MLKNKKFPRALALGLLALALVSTSGLSAQALASPRPAPWKALGTGNPLMCQRFAADPSALEYQGRLYIYSTADILERDAQGKVKDNSYSKIRHLNVISSDDLVNWTDHGKIDIAGAEGTSSWANNSWAPAVAMKNINGKDRIFIYFANSGGGIGVISGESPLGPFTDPIEEALVSKFTPGCKDIPWLFDPAVMVDTDGKAWLCFGGGVPDGADEHPMSSRVVQLGDDMTSIVGRPRMIDAPWIFEDSGLNKVGSKYIYTYCANWADRSSGSGEYDAPKAEIMAMEADSPLGPYKFLGSVLKNPGSFFGGVGNNHHSFFQFKGEWYVTYHSFVLQDALGYKGIYRSVHLDKAAVDDQNHFVPVQATLSGVPQIKALDPYRQVSAATMAWWGGAFETDCSKATPLKAGDWFGVKGADFGNSGSSSVEIEANSAKGCTLAVYADNFDSAPIALVKVPASPAHEPIRVKTPGIKLKGSHDLLFLCGSGEVEMKSWVFSK